ncbi:hypothetical protein [Geobacter sp. AOG1]|uniref:hypothetical protein n=1 Tax=Geobacter sp. AOG1 TaxID=1566346 RepID=UPI001CC47990|nr:hypothetical protein [Geobacter sp. AOG1]GFE57219.1 hypothetical protein AOG1_10990 [Geobacter sp. AOG1]
MEPTPYLTFWQVAEQWAEEMRRPIMGVVQIMRHHATYQYPHPTPCPVPSLLVWPTAYISPKGEINESTIYIASEMVKKENAPRLEELKGRESRYRTAYRTPEYIAAEAFFNSAACPPEPTEEIKKHLSLFAIRREDFREWCLGEGETLPKFWFPKEAQLIACPNEPSRKTSNLPDRKGKVVPESKRRKKADFTKAIDSLFFQLIEEGNIEVLKPGQTIAFLKSLKKRIHDDDKMKDSNQTYGELVKDVKINTSDECMLMQNPRNVRNKKTPESKWYTRNDVGKRLSELRSEHRGEFPLYSKK